MSNTIKIKRGTNLSNAGTPEAGELIYKSDTNELYVGNGSTAATGLTAIGGSATINNSNWSGTDLAVANGGTGASSFTSNAILTGNGTSAIQAESNLTFDGTTLNVSGIGDFEGSSSSGVNLYLGQTTSGSAFMYEFSTHDEAGGIINAGDHLQIKSYRWGQDISFARNGQGGAVPTARFFSSGSSGYFDLYKATDPTNNANYETRVKLNVNGDSYLNGGSIGIGLTNPSVRLHVKDASNDVYLRLETDKTNGNAQVQYFNDARQYNLGINNADKFSLWDNTASATRFDIATDGDFKFYGTGSNFESVGGGSATYLLLSGTATQRIEFRNTDSNANGWIGVPSWNTDAWHEYLPTSNGNELAYIYESSRHNYYKGFTVNNNQEDYDFIVKGDGNANLIRTDAANDRVGIGTASPSYTLDVSGNIRATGDLRASDDIVLDVNNNFLYARDASSTLIRVLGLSGANNFDIGPVDAYAGGYVRYSPAAQTTDHYFYTQGTYRLRVNQSYVYASNKLVVPDGSAGAPTYSFWNDSDTGILRYGTNQIGFSTQGTTRMVVKNAGVNFINHTGLQWNDRQIVTFKSNSNDRGVWNPWVSSIRNSGIQRHFDEEFEEGTNGVNLYNNAGGSNLVVSRITASDDSLVPPNKTGKVIKVAYNGNGTTSPNYGGIYQTISSEENHTFVQIFQAKLPNGRYFVINENAQGTRNTSYWLTDNYGTGKWEWYARVSHCGDSGTFHTGGHISVAGLADEAFTWYIASMTQYDVTESPYNYTSAGKGSSGQILKADGDGTYSWINNEASNAIINSGTWNGANFSGSRHKGLTINNGELSIQRDHPNNGQVSLLVDGGYSAGENNGFYSLYSGNSWNNRVGFYSDTSGNMKLNSTHSTGGFWFQNNGTTRIQMTYDGQFKWGSGANFGTLTWDTGKAIITSQGSNDLEIRRVNSSDMIDFEENEMRFVADGTERMAVNQNGVDLSGSTANKIVHNAQSTRDKYRVWTTSNYAIGMQSGFSFGGLGSHAMTFQMNEQANRGFWWGDDNHGQGAGAMALTTEGKLTLAHSMRLGYGESDTTTPGSTFTMDISGNNNLRLASGADQMIRFSRTNGNEISIEHDTSQIYFYNRDTSKAMFLMSNSGSAIMGYNSNPSFEIRNTATSAGSGGSLVFGHSQSGTNSVGRISSYLTDGSQANRSGHLRFWTRQSGTEGLAIQLQSNNHLRLYQNGDTTDYLELYVDDTKAYYHHAHTGSSSAYHRFITDNGYIELGPANTGWGHINTDRGKFYFNNKIIVDSGIVGSYDEDLSLRRNFSSSDGINDRIDILDDSQRFYVGNTEEFRVDGSGTLTSGQARATNEFQVNSSGTTLRRYVSSWNSGMQTHDVIYNGYGTNMGDYVYLKTSGNTATTHGMLLSSDQYLFWGRADVVTGAVTNSATAPIADVCMRVDASGNALFDGDVTAFSGDIASDIRLKKNIKDLNYGLKDVLNIRPVSFDWKEKRNGKHDIGFIAQEIEKIIPEVVNEVDTLNSEETHKTVDYAKLTSVLIKAVQEQQQQINELKEKLNG